MLTTYDPSLDAVIAASNFHSVLLENDEIRVLEVAIPPGVKEPFHTHSWPSIFVVFGTPRLRYFTPEVEGPLFEIEPQLETGVLHLAPEGPHSLENVDQRDLRAFRIEMKRAPASDRAPIRGPVLEVGTPGEGLYLENSAVRLCHAGAAGSVAGRSSVLLRRGEPKGTAEWFEEAGSARPFSSNDIVLTLKYL